MHSATVEQALSPDPVALSEPHRLALALADSVMTRPGDLDADTAAALRHAFSPEQIVELTLKVLKFNVQKVMVTLGTHTWIDAEQIDKVRWNQDGTYVIA